MKMNSIIHIAQRCIVLILFLTLCSINSFAEVYSGTCGDNLNWSLDTSTGLLEITGTGDMYDYASGTSPWYANRGYIISLSLPDGLTSIGVRAFELCGRLTGSLTIPNSVTSIGGFAFWGCSGFTGSLTLPDGLTYIEAHAFSGCSRLTGSLTIPNGVTTIEEYAFSDCRGFTGSLTIPNGVTTIEEYAFNECRGLTGSLTIPNSVTSIGQFAFYDCHGFTGSLTIPNSVTSIGSSAFEYCSGLNGSLTIPNSVTSIGFRAFNDCANLSAIQVLATTPPAIQSSTFTNYNVPLLVPCGSLSDYKNATYWKKFTNIIDFPFVVFVLSNNTDFGTVTYSHNCVNSTVTLTARPKSDYSFLRWDDGNTTNPRTVSVHENTTFTATFAKLSGKCGDNLYWSLNPQTGILEITGTGDMYDYRAGTSPWYAYREYITSLSFPDGMTSIGAYAFWGCSGLIGSLTIPNSVTSIGERAFDSCSGLTGSLMIPNGVTSIGEYAFYNCSGFTGSLTIPNGVTAIEGHTFQNCSGLTGSLTIPNGVTSIGASAFSGCSGLNGSLTIPNSVKTIEGSAFSGCSSLTGSLTIPNSVTSIEIGAFSGCSGFNGSLTISNNVKTIGSIVFSGCSGLTGSLTIPNSVTSIGGRAFNNCTNLSAIHILVPIPITIQNLTFTNYDVPLFVPCGSLSNYQNAAYWKNFTRIIEFPYIVSAISNNTDYGTVTYSLNCVNSTITLTAVPKSNYRFVCWNDGNADNPRTVSVHENTTFTATFGEKSFTISFNPNYEGAESESLEYEYGTETYETLPCINRSLYTFDGWYTAPEGGMLVTTETPLPQEPHTLYAHWRYVGGPTEDGVIPYPFTVNADGDQVYFSKGELQYKPSTDEVRFAEMQMDTTYDINNNKYTSSTYDGWVDMFGFGASNATATSMDDHPMWLTSTDGSYYTLSPYDDNSVAFSIAHTEYDWGHNAISNGGNTSDIWYTLSTSEWEYVLFKRKDADKKLKLIHFGYNPILVLMPDDWNPPTDKNDFMYTFNDEIAYSTRQYRYVIPLISRIKRSADPYNITSSTPLLDSNTFWEEEYPKLLDQGAVVLSLGGYRQGASVFYIYNTSSSIWTSNARTNGARALKLTWEKANPYHNDYSGVPITRAPTYYSLDYSQFNNRYYGYYVRLVQSDSVFHNKRYLVDVLKEVEQTMQVNGIIGIGTKEIGLDTLGYFGAGEVITVTPPPMEGYHAYYIEGSPHGNFSTPTGGIDSIFMRTTYIAHYHPDTLLVTLNSATNNEIPSVTRNVVFNEPYHELPIIERPHYTFNGWFTDPVGGIQITADSIVTISTDHSLYAHWIPDATTFTMHFTDGHGLSIDSILEVHYGDTLNVIPPDIPGGVFVSWGDGTTAPFEYIVNEPGEVTVIVTPNQYTVTFVSNMEGIANTTQTVTYGHAYGTLPELTNSNFSFVGWFTDSNEGDLISETSIVTTTKSHSLYAHWSIKPYVLNVTISGSGNVTGNAGRYLETELATLEAIPDSCYQFSHWEDGSTDPIRTLQPSVCPSVEAYFEPAIYTIRVEADQPETGDVDAVIKMKN